MAKRRPIAEYYEREPLPDVIVGDDSGNVSEAGWWETDGWVDLTIPEQMMLPPLPFEPTWFEVRPSRELRLPRWLH